MAIGFEGPAFPGAPQPQPPGTYTRVSEYFESGMWFRRPQYPDSLLIVGSGVSWGPDNGTAYLGTLLNTIVAVSSLSGVPFSLSSLDAGAFPGLPSPGALRVIGYRQDDTTVTNDFNPSRSGFQTFYFSSGFIDLTRVEMKGGYALDNLVIGIPEPSAAALALLGAACALWSGRLGRRRHA